MTHEENEAVYNLAKDRLEQANNRIIHKGGNISYDLWDNGNGKFSIRARRAFMGNDGLRHFRYLYSVLVDVDLYSAYFCACGIEDATSINYL